MHTSNSTIVMRVFFTALLTYLGRDAEFLILFKQFLSFLRGFTRRCMCGQIMLTSLLQPVQRLTEREKEKNRNEKQCKFYCIINFVSLYSDFIDKKELISKSVNFPLLFWLNKSLTGDYQLSGSVITIIMNSDSFIWIHFDLKPPLWSNRSLWVEFPPGSIQYSDSDHLMSTKKMSV